MQMKHMIGLVGLVLISVSTAAAQSTTQARAQPAGKIAPRPLFRDPVFDAPTDPVLCFNTETNKWFMYYTQRRATAPDTPSVTWIHGTKIGMASSSDGGATWTYMGEAKIDYAQKEHPGVCTYWAPEVIWINGTYHMYLSFVPGIFTDWNHPREIVHLTSKDGIQWDTVGPIDLKSDRVIDACVIQLPGGTWRMWYKDERKPKALAYADSPDLYRWEPQGNAVTEHNGEGPKVIHWKGKYWLIADIWSGQGVWSSDDCTNWKLQDGVLLGNHGDVVVNGDRAWWFYFGGTSDVRSRGPINWAVNPASILPGAVAAQTTVASVPAPSRGRTTAINAVELRIIDGRLMYDDPAQPTYIDLKLAREEER